MAAVLKDKRIELWEENRDEYEYDDEGHLIPAAPVSLGKFWAAYRHESSKEFIAASTVGYEEDAIFIVNYNPVWKDLDTNNHYITYNGSEYDINGFDDYKGGKKDIRISTKARKR